MTYFPKCGNPDWQLPFGGITAAYRFLYHCGDLVPDALLQFMFAASPLIASRFGVRSRQHRQRFSDMLRQASPSFVRWAAGAMLEWTGTDNLSVPIYHVHGQDDRIIPLSCVAADLVVRNAGHMVNVTHPSEVNAFIDAAISACMQEIMKRESSAAIGSSCSDEIHRRYDDKN